MIADPANSTFRSRISGGRSVRSLALGLLLLLGVCVFAWGLNYKLSLYAPPHSVAHRMPAAKLVPGKERSAVPAVDLRQPDRSNLPLALTILALLFLVLRMPRLNAGFVGSLGLVPPRHPAARTLARVHAVRPPPSVR